MRFAVNDIYESALKLMLPLDSESTYNTICHEALRLVNAFAGSMFLLENDELRRVYSTVEEDKQFDPRPEGFTWQALKQQQAVIVTHSEIVKYHPEIAQTGTKSIIFIPLIYEQHSFGILTLRSYRTRDFGKKKLYILQLFASLASLKLRNNALFNEMNDALAARDLFISMASHELKTPLTTMLMYIELMHKSLKAQQPIQEKWVASLSQSARRLRNLVNGLLEITSIQQGRLTFNKQSTQLKLLIEEAVIDFYSSFPLRRVQLSLAFKANVKVNVDPFRLLQLLNNLMNNAAKYSPEESAVNLTVKSNNKNLVIEVCDEGPGIPEQDIPKLFTQYFRGKTNKQGLGIGLYVSKVIVEAHMGTIEVDSEVGKGTTIRVTMPVVEV